VRGLRVHHICSIAAALGAVLPHWAVAQEFDVPSETSITGDDPNSDPGGLDIQRPRPRLLAMLTFGAGHEYRDRLLSNHEFGSLSVGVAYMGFSASAVKDWEVSTGRASHEILLGYSYKLPFVDVHASYVACGNDYMLDGCPDAARFTLTTNSIRKATLEASFDRAFGSSHHTISASVTRELWANEKTSGALRVGWTRTNYEDSTNLDGASIRLIASRQLSNAVSIDFAVGSIKTTGLAQLPVARDGAFATTSLVWRY
jgi:hypothetical protein